MENQTCRNGSETEQCINELAVRSPAYVNPPEWLLKAVTAPTQSHYVDCARTNLHYRSWNLEDVEKPTLLFVHGYKANSYWWDFIAPAFTQGYRVFAMDFSGMGLSGHRPLYTSEVFTQDILTVLEILGPATVVGHSYGGMQTLRACAQRPDLIQHALILDSRVCFAGVDEPSTQPAPKGKDGLPYPDYPTIRARYRVIPEQPLPIQDILEHIAFYSIKENAEGWNWSFDPALPYGIALPDGDDLLPRIDVPVDYVYGEKSIVVEPWRAERIVSGLRRGRGPTVIPESYHHLMLDQPLTLISVLRALLAKRPD